MYLKDYGSTTYVVVDDDLDLKLEIDLSKLENPKFDLIKWYLNYVRRDGKFYEKYVEQRHEYQSEIDTGTPPTEQLCAVASTSVQEDLDELVIMRQVTDVLEHCSPYPGDDNPRYPIDPRYRHGDSRFVLDVTLEQKLLCVYDRLQGSESYLSWDLAAWDQLSLGKWYAERCAVNRNEGVPWETSHEWMQSHNWDETTRAGIYRRRLEATLLYEDLSTDDESDDEYLIDTPGNDDETDDMGAVLTLSGIQVDRNKYATIQRNAARVKGVDERFLPKSVVIRVVVNGSPLRALVDSGSLGDFVSSTVVDQLKLKRTVLDKPLGLQLAVQGSRSKITASVDVNYSYQHIKNVRRFDIANLNDYDMILGTPWMYQHQVCIGLNPARIVIGSDEPLPILSGTDTKYLLGSSSFVADIGISDAQELLMAYAEPLCRNVEDTELPPFRAINHSIPLIDENKVYPWRPSRCPEVFRTQWNEKRDAYLKSGRWKVTTARNTVPMLLIPKPHKPKNAPELRTVIDLRERNKNTVKMLSPLPDIEGVLRRVTAKPFRSVLDLTAAYEQIRIIPEHVDRSAVTTPDGNMVSLVLQMGDCNAPATYQSLMNHIFSAYLGRFLDVYLDDIIIYSDTLDDHVDHCRLVLDILRKEKLYLSKSKIRFLPDEMKLLGRIIDAQGIRMDPEKVDGVLAWKTPTNRDLLRGFIGSVGYLADDIPNIRLPLGVLSAITGNTVPFRWTYTEQRAFDEAKRLTQLSRDHRRWPVSYGVDAPQVWMVTDGCSTGIAGVVSQGPDWKTAAVAAFYSAKLNNAQRNYPVHEIEMLAGVETMLRHRDVLQGVHFKWVTDHRGLIYLLNQKSVSGRQARWLEKISSFIFEVVYAPGSENVLADALSRIYSDDAPGTERVRSEFTDFDITDDEPAELITDMVLLAGINAVVATHRDSTEPGAETGCPETSKEFARRMKNKFVLRGPHERTEGESGNKLPTTAVLDEQRTADHVDADADVDADLDRDIVPSVHSEPNPDTSQINVLNVMYRIF